MDPLDTRPTKSSNSLLLTNLTDTPEKNSNSFPSLLLGLCRPPSVNLKQLYHAMFQKNPFFQKKIKQIRECKNQITTKQTLFCRDDEENIST